MSEQPGTPDPDDPNGDEPEGEDFGFVAGSHVFDSSLSLELGGVEQDPEVGKRAFDAAIPALNVALQHYAHALEERGGADHRGPAHPWAGTRAVRRLRGCPRGP